MEDILKKLQDEVDITERQAVKVIAVLKEEMEKGNLDIDWNKFMKGRYADLLEKAKNLFGETSGEVSKLAGNLSDKADTLADSAKEKLRDLSQKAADYFDDKKK